MTWKTKANVAENQISGMNKLLLPCYNLDEMMCQPVSKAPEALQMARHWLSRLIGFLFFLTQNVCEWQTWLGITLCFLFSGLLSTDILHMNFR